MKLCTNLFEIIIEQQSKHAHEGSACSMLVFYIIKWLHEKLYANELKQT